MSSSKELIYNNWFKALQPSDGLRNAKADESDRQSSATRNEHEDKINVADVVELSKTIDHCLAIWDANLTVSKSKEDASKPTFRKFAKHVSKKIKNVFHKLSQGSLQTVGELLNSLVGVPWFGVGFFLLGTIIKQLHKFKEIERKQVETIKENERGCFKIVKSMYELAKIIMDLQHLPYKSENMLMAIAESIHIIMTGVGSCHRIMENGLLKGKENAMERAEGNRQELMELRQQVQEMRSTLNVHISLCILRGLCMRPNYVVEGSLDQQEYTPSDEVDKGISQGESVFKSSNPRINLKRKFDNAVGDGLKNEDASRKRKCGVVQKLKNKISKGGRK